MSSVCNVCKQCRALPFRAVLRAGAAPDFDLICAKCAHELIEMQTNHLSCVHRRNTMTEKLFECLKSIEFRDGSDVAAERSEARNAQLWALLDGFAALNGSSNDSVSSVDDDVNNENNANNAEPLASSSSSLRAKQKKKKKRRKRREQKSSAAVHSSINERNNQEEEEEEEEGEEEEDNDEDSTNENVENNNALDVNDDEDENQSFVPVPPPYAVLQPYATAAELRFIEHAKGGELAAMKEMVARGDVAAARVDAVSPERHMTALCKAAGFSNSLETVRWLLALGANPAATDVNSDTPLHWACYHGCMDIATCLVDAGAPADAFSGLRRTPLDDAVMRGHNLTATMLRIALTRHDVRRRLRQRRTILDAAKDGDVEEMATLVAAHGAHIVNTVRDVRGMAALQRCVAECPDSPKKWRALQWLVEHGADVDHVDRFGDSAIHWSPYCVREECTLFLASKAQLNYTLVSNYNLTWVDNAAQFANDGGRFQRMVITLQHQLDLQLRWAKRFFAAARRVLCARAAHPALTQLPVLLAVAGALVDMEYFVWLESNNQIDLETFILAEELPPQYYQYYPLYHRRSASHSATAAAAAAANAANEVIGTPDSLLDEFTRIRLAQAATQRKPALHCLHVGRNAGERRATRWPWCDATRELRRLIRLQLIEE